MACWLDHFHQTVCEFAVRFILCSCARMVLLQAYHSFVRELTSLYSCPMVQSLRVHTQVRAVPNAFVEDLRPCQPS